jgi:hypothetical protein
VIANDSVAVNIARFGDSNNPGTLGVFKGVRSVHRPTGACTNDEN